MELKLIVKKHQMSFKGLEIFGLMITTRKQLEKAKVNINVAFKG